MWLQYIISIITNRILSWTFGESTLRHKSSGIQYGVHKLGKNSCASHHVKHDGIQVTPNYGRAGKQPVSRHSIWLFVRLERVLSDEFVELTSPRNPMKMFILHTSSWAPHSGTAQVLTQSCILLSGPHHVDGGAIWKAWGLCLCHHTPPTRGTRRELAV
jgi:hypothetical protein